MRWLFVPGLNCSPDIWEGADRLDGEVAFARWPTEGIECMEDGARWLAGEVARNQADVVVGHSHGGTTLLHLYGHLGHQPLPRLVVVDSFMAPPHEMFRNHVWQGTDELRARIRSMIDEERPRYQRLGEVAMGFEEDHAWIEAAVGTGATFVYGGRGEGDADEVGRRAGVPEANLSQVRLVPNTSHFLMLEQPDAFYEFLAREVGR